MTLPNLPEADSKFTPEQRAYIQKYAAGLLVAWTGDVISNFITPDVGDGFVPPAGVFPQEQGEEDKDVDYMLAAHGEVIELLDNWFEKVAKLAGFSDMHEAWAAVGDSHTAYAKYPVMKN